MDNIPSEALFILGSLFQKGNLVDSFKIAGNNYGFSVTLHLSMTKTEISDSSPLATPSTQRNTKALL